MGDKKYTKNTFDSGSLPFLPPPPQVDNSGSQSDPGSPVFIRLVISSRANIIPLFIRSTALEEINPGYETIMTPDSKDKVRVVQQGWEGRKDNGAERDY